MADWTDATPEDIALVRQAVEDRWPTTRGPEVLAALESKLDAVKQGRKAIRLARLAMRIHAATWKKKRRKG